MKKVLLLLLCVFLPFIIFGGNGWTGYASRTVPPLPPEDFFLFCPASLNKTTSPSRIYSADSGENDMGGCKEIGERERERE